MIIFKYKKEKQCRENCVEYTKTTSLVIKHLFVRTIIKVALFKGWFLSQLDVYNVFINVDFDEIVYMVQSPSGFEYSNKEEKKLMHHICYLSTMKKY